MQNKKGEWEGPPTQGINGTKEKKTEGRNCGTPAARVRTHSQSVILTQTITQTASASRSREKYAATSARNEPSERGDETPSIWRANFTTRASSQSSASSAPPSPPRLLFLGTARPGRRGGALARSAQSEERSAGGERHYLCL